ncbi:MAG: hypothetical protein M1549_00750 [Candidatus Dependentiae bacterium]|nr:hypothetical protein [Candidatus Dependentiae bacterium]
MKTLSTQYTRNLLLFSLSASMPIALQAMETTKRSLPVSKVLELKFQKNIDTPSSNMTLDETVEKYYEENETLLVSNSALVNTINKIQKILAGEAVGDNLAKLVHSARNGARLLYEIAQGDVEFSSQLAKTISHAEVCDIMRYLYLQSCKIRPDETGFKEGIIILPPGDPYTEKLRTLLSLYWLQRKSDEEFILSAKTQDAFRLMCAESCNDKNGAKDGEKKDMPVRFLDRFDNFHITVPVDVKKGIRIKLERHPKVGIINKIKTRAGRTPDFGPEFNKETDVPQNLVEKFLKTFPQKSESGKLTKNFSSMYNQILAELNSPIDDSRKYELFSCQMDFEKLACKENMSHLGIRVGSEIILGEERLSESAFSETGKGEQEKMAKGLFLAFVKMRKLVRTYALAAQSSKGGEQAMREEIENFYALIAEKTWCIKDEAIRSYYQNTARILKYVTSLKAEDPKSPAASLSGQLRRPLFEKAYQATLTEEVKEFIKNLSLENDKIKSQELAVETDDALACKVNDFSGNYIGQDKDLTKKFEATFDKNTRISDIIMQQDDIKKLMKKPFTQFIRLHHNLTSFPKTRAGLINFLSYLLGTAKDIIELEQNFEKRQKFSAMLGSLKNDVTKLFATLADVSERKGYICSSSPNGRRIINSVERPKFLLGGKNPDAIGQLKKIPQLFASEQALKDQVTYIYEKI